MKKILVLLLTLMLICMPALAEESINVFVTVTDGEGAFGIAYEPVAVTDADGDGALTIADALACAHAQYHPEGAGAFAAGMTEYGLSLTRLWGVENGGAYGYCCNNASAWSLADPVAAGDHVQAYVYTDTETWSDTYCYFNIAAMGTAAGAEVALVLTANGYDENYNPVALPVEGAVITLNGEPTEFVTDADGLVLFAVDAAGEYVVSAVSDTQNLVPPVSILTVAE